MRAYLALISINLKLAMREKVVLFFNFVFPLVFFFAFGQMMDASMGGLGVRVVSMVLVLGVLGNGLFGAGIRAVVEREVNILRRYKVTPISAAPLLVASLITGWLMYLPVIFLILGLAHLMWDVAWPSSMLSFVVLLSVGAWAMRAIGLIVAAVVNSAAESNVILQLLYMPMLFLSGATFPLSMLPDWARIVAQFLPASYLHSGMERVMVRGDTLADISVPLLALLVSTVVGTFIAVKIFRWEKEEVLPARAKLWLLAVGLPFILLGVYQAHSRENIDDSLALERQMRRNRTRLIRDARVFTGDGEVIEGGAILIRGGKIAEVYSGDVPSPETLNAEVIEAAGKTVLPGLIDAGIHLSAPGGTLPESPEIDEPIERRLAAYLYSGVTTVASGEDPVETALDARMRITRGLRLGAEVFAFGPLFTAEGGDGSAAMPARIQAVIGGDALRSPKSPDEAGAMVRDLAQRGIDGVKVAISGPSAQERMSVAVLNAIAEEARTLGLPLIVRTGDLQGIRDALDAGASGIEQGTWQEAIPDELLARMAADGVTFTPELSAGEAAALLAAGRADLLSRSLVEQVAEPGLIASTKAALAQATRPPLVDLSIAQDNLRRAHEAGVTLVAGTGSGSPLLVHGPAVHRELQLWVEAGIPQADALRAATANPAKLLSADKRIGRIAPGYEANLLIVSGNPLDEIAATERISEVLFQGELIDRADLFSSEQ